MKTTVSKSEYDIQAEKFVKDADFHFAKCVTEADRHEMLLEIMRVECEIFLIAIADKMLNIIQNSPTICLSCGNERPLNYTRDGVCFDCIEGLDFEDNRIS